MLLFMLVSVSPVKCRASITGLSASTQLKQPLWPLQLHDVSGMPACLQAAQYCHACNRHTADSINTTTPAEGKIIISKRRLQAVVPCAPSG